MPSRSRSGYGRTVMAHRSAERRIVRVRHSRVGKAKFSLHLPTVPIEMREKPLFFAEKLPFRLKS